jgi:hypothetical protein
MLPEMLHWLFHLAGVSSKEDVAEALLYLQNGLIHKHFDDKCQTVKSN